MAILGQVEKAQTNFFGFQIMILSNRLKSSSAFKACKDQSEIKKYRKTKIKSWF